MNKEEYKARAEEIRTLVGENRLTEAMEIADTIDWHRVRGEKMLCLVSDLYKFHRRYEESLDILMMAYERNPSSSEMVRSLCELSTKLNDLLGAVEYLKEFIRLAPADARRYLLQYRLYEAQDVSLEERIAVLEEYKKHEYKPRWAYELAYLYHRVGLQTECVTQCDEMAEWFGQGVYVVKALELKSLHAPLTEAQQEILNREKEVMSGSEVSYSRLDTDAAPTIRIPQRNMQAALKDAQAPTGATISVPTMDVANQYNTMNLQAALAEGVRDILGPEESAVATTERAPRAGSPRSADSQYERMLNEQSDGQIAMAVEDTGQVERQITGQISIDDIMDRIRREQQERQEKRVQQIVEVRTLGMFNSFDEEAGKATALETPETPEERTFFPTDDGTETRHTVVRPDEGVMPYVQAGQMAKPANALEALMQAQRLREEAEAEEAAAEEAEEEEEAGPSTDAGTANAEEEAEEAAGEAAEAEEEVTEAAEAEEEVSEEDEGPSTGAGTANAEEDTEEAPKEAEAEEEEDASAEEETAEEAPDDTESEEEEEESDEEERADEPLKGWEADAKVWEDEAEEAEEVSEEEAEPSTDAGTAAAKEETEEEEAEPESLAKETTSEEKAGPEESKEEETPAKEEPKEEKTPAAAAAKEEKEAPEGKAEEKDEKRPIERRIEAMSDKEKALYGSFLHNKDTCNQIVMAIDRLNVNSGYDNAVVTGKDNEATLNLARGLIRSVAAANPDFSGKVAKIKGDAFQAAKVESSFEKLEHGALIITGAARMGRDLKAALTAALSDGTHHLLVILIDSEKHIHDLLNRNQELQKLFNIVINAEHLNDDGLVAFGREYAREKEFSIDNLGLLALHTRIESLQTYDHMVSTEEVMEIVDEAIANASKKNISHFADVLFRKRFDDEDMVILREKDFLP